MKRSLITGSLITVLVALVCISLAGIAVAQGAQNMRPRYKVLPPHDYFPAEKSVQPVTPLTQWTYSFTYQGSTYNDVFVGTDPSKTNATTTVTIGIIPIKMVYGPSNGNMTFDPAAPYYKTFSTTDIVKDGPIFKPLFDYNQGGTDLGKTQYEDAYQRGNFWSDVMTNTKYHLLFKTVLGPEQTLNVPEQAGNVISGGGIAPGNVGTANINWFDLQLQTIMQKFPQIQPNILPLFITYQVYLTENGCCIGGYHSAKAGPPNGQTYAYSTTVNQFSNGSAAFAQDVGALAHEMGEWILDPFTDNNSPCGIMENGDPLETEPNYGDFPYTIDGFTFHPQDLVFIDYFGAPNTIPVNGWYTFQNETNADVVCSRGSK
jgi:hypothetical protein